MTQIERLERRTPEQWAALVKEYEASGQSQRGFCAERGIGQSSLRYWRRRLPGDRPDGGRMSGTQLMPVRVCADKPSHPGSGLTLVVGKGVRIEISPEFDAVTLERVLATLEAVA